METTDMLDKANFSTRPPQRAKRNPAPGKKTLAETLELASRLNDRAYAIIFGKHGEKLLDDILSASSDNLTLPYYPGLHAIRDFIGGVVGFRLPGGLEVDYSNPDALTNTRTVLQGSAAGLAHYTGDAAEQRLYHALRRADARAINADRAAAGLGDLKNGIMPRRLASRIAGALVFEAIRNAVGAPGAGALYLLSTLPPRFRAENADILVGDDKGILLRDTLSQLAVLLLFPRCLRDWAAGRKRKDVLASLGLPRNAHKMGPRAAGVVSWLSRRHDGDDLCCEIDLDEWLTEPLLDVFPEASFRQRLLCDVAIRASRRMEPALVENFAIWFASQTLGLKSEADLPEPDRIGLVDFAAAPPAMLDAAAVAGWGDKVSFAEACDRARLYAAWVRVTVHGLDATPFPTPAWGPAAGPITGSRWRLIRVESGEMLEAEGRRLSNCAVTYATDCQRAVSAIYVLRRRATKVDKPRHVHHCQVIGGPAITGSMVEFRDRGDGTARIMQHLGRFNHPAPASCWDALHRHLPRA
jgi:hypothetical protein